MKTYREISEEDLSLTEREALSADRLAESVEPFDQDEHLALWAKEARRRLEEFRSGTVQAIPGDEVFASLWRKFGK